MITPKEFDIQIPLFDTSMFVAICSRERFIELLEQNNIEFDLREDCDGLCITPQGKAPLLWVENTLKKSDYSFLAILNHEILHVVLTVLDDIGTPIEKENDEVICYFQQHILKEILKEIKY